jgi:hypothetical protein
VGRDDGRLVVRGDAAPHQHAAVSAVVDSVTLTP